MDCGDLVNLLDVRRVRFIYTYQSVFRTVPTKISTSTSFDRTNDSVIRNGYFPWILEKVYRQLSSYRYADVQRPH